MIRVRFVFASGLIVFVAAIGFFAYMKTAFAATDIITLKPNATATSAWTGGGTTDNSCSGNCMRVDDGATANDGDYVETSGTTAEVYDHDNTTGGQTATSITFTARAQRSARGQVLGILGLVYNGQDDLIMDMTINGTSLGAETKTIPNNETGVYHDFTLTKTGTWTQAQIDSLRTSIQKTPIQVLLTNGDTLRVSWVKVDVTWRSPDISQNTSRIYQNANAATPGAPLGAANALTDVPRSSQFRVHEGLKVSDYDWQTGTWGAHNNLYKLQYVARGLSGTCAAPSGTWTDVGSSSPIQWYDNTNVAIPTAYTAATSEPPLDTGSTASPQRYVESNGFGPVATTTVGNTAMWDFSLAASSTATPGYYCLRVVKNDNTLLSAYTRYPEIAVTGDYSVGIVDNAGADVVSPLVAFPVDTVSTTQCSLSSATLGTSLQKIRINNDLKTNGWNISMAATNGPAALWTSGSSYYDFNDPTGSTAGCSDGTDADAYGGQLRVNPISAQLTPKSGCSSTGVSKGTDAKFSEGTTNSITLASGDASSLRFCYWDMTGVNLEQRLPARVQAGAYSLDMTITMAAL